MTSHWRQARKRDTLARTNRVASSARRGLTLRSWYKGQRFTQILRCELGTRSHRRQRSCDESARDREDRLKQVPNGF
jgi:hypothetical protein